MICATNTSNIISPQVGVYSYWLIEKQNMIIVNRFNDFLNDIASYRVNYQYSTIIHQVGLRSYLLDSTTPPAFTVRSAKLIPRIIGCCNKHPHDLSAKQWVRCTCPPTCWADTEYQSEAIQMYMQYQQWTQVWDHRFGDCNEPVCREALYMIQKNVHAKS